MNKEYLYPMDAAVSPILTSDFRTQSLAERTDYSLSSKPARSLSSRYGLPNVMLAFATLTSPHVPINEYADYRRTSSAPIIWNVPHRGRRISLREARKLALKILEETERELREERSAEARFLLGAWENRDAEN